MQKKCSIQKDFNSQVSCQIVRAYQCTIQPIRPPTHICSVSDVSFASGSHWNYRAWSTNHLYCMGKTCAVLWCPACTNAFSPVNLDSATDMKLAVRKMNKENKRHSWIVEVNWAIFLLFRNIDYRKRPLFKSVWTMNQKTCSCNCKISKIITTFIKIFQFWQLHERENQILFCSTARFENGFDHNIGGTWIQHVLQVMPC